MTYGIQEVVGAIFISEEKKMKWNKSALIIISKLL